MISLKGYAGNCQFNEFVIEERFEKAKTTTLYIRPYTEGAPLDCMIFQLDSEETKDCGYFPSISITHDETEALIKYLQETLARETKRKCKMEPVVEHYLTQHFNNSRDFPEILEKEES